MRYNKQCVSRNKLEIDLKEVEKKLKVGEEMIVKMENENNVKIESLK